MIEECPVCCEDITIADKLHCGHIIHKTCIISSGKAECPICRSKLRDMVDKVVEITLDPPEWGTLDKMVSLGWLNHADIPIIDDLSIPSNNDLLLVKAILLLYVIKKVLFYDSSSL